MGKHGAGKKAKKHPRSRSLSFPVKTCLRKPVSVPPSLQEVDEVAEERAPRSSYASSSTTTAPSTTTTSRDGRFPTEHLEVEALYSLEVTAANAEKTLADLDLLYDDARFMVAHALLVKLQAFLAHCKDQGLKDLLTAKMEGPELLRKLKLLRKRAKECQEALTVLEGDFPLLPRDCLLRGYATDYSERDMILICADQFDEDTKLDVEEPPKLTAWFSERMYITNFRCKIQLDGVDKGTLIMAAKIEPNMKLPQSAITFGIKKIIGLLLHLIHTNATKCQEKPDASVHAARIKEDAYYGQGFLPRVLWYCDKKRWHWPGHPSLPKLQQRPPSHDSEPLNHETPETSTTAQVANKAGIFRMGFTTLVNKIKGKQALKPSPSASVVAKSNPLPPHNIMASTGRGATYISHTPSPPPTPNPLKLVVIFVAYTISPLMTHVFGVLGQAIFLVFMVYLSSATAASCKGMKQDNKLLLAMGVAALMSSLVFVVCTCHVYKLVPRDGMADETAWTSMVTSGLGLVKAVGLLGRTT